MTIIQAPNSTPKMKAESTMAVSITTKPTLESIITRGRWKKASMDVVSLYISKDKSEVAK